MRLNHVLLKWNKMKFAYKYHESQESGEVSVSMTWMYLASLAQSERSWVQFPARHYNNVWHSTRLKTSFELNPVAEGKQGTFILAGQLTTQNFNILIKQCEYLQNKSTLNWHKSKKYCNAFRPLEPNQTICNEWRKIMYM